MIGTPHLIYEVFDIIFVHLICFQTTLKNLEDASEELLLLDEDDCPNLPYLAGETFVYYNLETTQVLL